MSSSRYIEQSLTKSSHKYGCHYQSFYEPHSHAPYSKRLRYETTPSKNKNEHHFHHIKDFIVSSSVIHSSF